MIIIKSLRYFWWLVQDRLKLDEKLKQVCSVQYFLHSKSFRNIKINAVQSNAIFLWTLKHTKLNLAGPPRFVNILKIILLIYKKTLHIKTKHSEIKL